MKLAIISKGENNAVWYYRILPWLYLGRQISDIHTQVVNPANLNAFEAVIPGFDVLIIQRPSTQRDYQAMLLAKQYNVRVLVDYDDLLFQVPNVNIAAQHFGKDEVQETILNCYKLADHVTVSTAPLADYMEQAFGKRPQVVNNAHNDIVMPIFQPAMNEPKNGISTVLWRGSNTHLGDLMKYREAFQDFANIDFHFWGAAPDLALGRDYGGYLDVWNYKPWQPGMPDYFKNGKSLKPNFVVVPLEDNPFNRAKSFIGWLEGTYFGAVCLASGLPEFQKNGVIKIDDAVHLEQTFKDINEDAAFWGTFYLLSVEEIQKNYLLTKVNAKRAEALNIIWR